MIEVDAASAKITTDFKGADPDVFVDPTGFSGDPAVLGHLTKGFTAGNIAKNTTMASAWTATGEVAVKVGANDQADLAKWHFGFIQFQHVVTFNADYAGRSMSDGGIAIRPNGTPALTSSAGRDSDLADPNKPFMRVNTAGNLTFDAAKGLAIGKMSDHPGFSLPATRLNNKTKYDNFISRVIDEREFVTVFSARDPQGVYLHLAHFVWSVRWDFIFGWSPGGMPIKSKEAGSKITPPKAAVLGAPTQKWVKNFLADPKTAPRCGSSETSAAVRVSLSGGPPNRLDLDARFGIIAPNFKP